MVDPDAGIAAVKADGEDVFRGAGAVAAPHRSIDAGDADVVADPRGNQRRIARQRRPRDRSERRGRDAAKLPAPGVGVGDRDEPFDRAARRRANPDGVPRTGAFVSAFLHRAARVR